VRHHVSKPSLRAVASGNTLLAVSYSRSTLASSAQQIAGREQAAGASLVQTIDYPERNVTQHVISVPTAKLTQAESSLQTQAGVQSVGLAGGRRFHMTTIPVYTNDPYFTGFAPSNFEKLPFAESASVPGQWDMHVIGLEHAYGYSQNGATYTSNPAALGSASIKIAIIDTGEDASHPELAGKIAHQQCYITNDAGTSQSTGNFTTDEDGHGTDVAGIAAAATNNTLGFSGVGGKSVIYAYRVFPTPDDTCASDTNSDDTCSAGTADIAAAINDAVNVQHVNVISMSLGGGSCTNGVDDDSVENAAVVNAISKNVIVVAASGNDNTGTPGVTAPGCDTGVIAVGATGLADGQATGSTGNFTSTAANNASATNVVEYVASYSQFGSPGASVQSSSAWGIVAPGGDPTGSGLTSSDNDDLHWIENIWTSTPLDNNFSGTCTSDLNSNSQPDCRTLIAGTSMATPHVAGAAALILAVAPQFGTPAMMKQLLCSTADDISDTHEGCGRLNVYRAMAKAIGDSALP
jgi:subtilisin family serine protease